MLQWHEKAVDAAGRLPQRSLVRLSPRPAAEGEGGAPTRSPHNDGLRALTWDYPTKGRAASRTPKRCCKEINGSRARHRRAASRGFTRARARRLDRVRLLDLLRRLPAPKTAIARATRAAHGPYGHGWGYAWPADRRILYNRASARPDGQPWSERKKLVWWDETRRRMDRASTRRISARTTPPPTRRRVSPTPAQGCASEGGPFIMHADGLGWLWVPTRPQGWTAARALRAARIAGRESDLRSASRIRRPTGARAGQRVGRFARRPTSRTC